MAVLSHNGTAQSRPWRCPAAAAHGVGDGAPAAQVEVTHAKIGPLRDAHRLLERGHQLAVFGDVVKNLGHG